MTVRVDGERDCLGGVARRVANAVDGHFVPTRFVWWELYDPSAFGRGAGALEVERTRQGFVAYSIVHGGSSASARLARFNNRHGLPRTFNGFVKDHAKELFSRRDGTSFHGLLCIHRQREPLLADEFVHGRFGERWTAGAERLETKFVHVILESAQEFFKLVVDFPIECAPLGS